MEPQNDAKVSESLRVENISKSFRHVQALSDVTLEVDKGEVVGVVGENGAGKSTLLKILTGVLSPDSGNIFVGGDRVTFKGPREAAEAGVSLVHQEQDVIPNLRGYENLLMGHEDDRWGILNHGRMRKQTQEYVESLGMNLDVGEYVRNYSFNERQMLEIASAFYTSRDSSNPVILLDEPTAGLEEEGRNLLFERINDLRNQATFIFVSHELDEVLEISDRIYVLKDGNLVDEYQADEATANELQRSMVGRESSDEYYKVQEQLYENELGDTVLEVNNLQLDDDLGPISFSLRRGEILGIVGVESSGKERLGRILAGDLPPTQGEIEVDGESIQPKSPADMVDVGVGYIPKDRKQDGLLLYQSVQMNTSLAMVRDMMGKLPLLNRSEESSITEEMIDRLDIKTPGKGALVHGLSGGNQQKVVISRWLAQDSPVLVMDNVCRGLDVGAKEQVYEIIRNLTSQGVSIIFIGDELLEVIGMANRIIPMKDGKIVDEPMDASPGHKPTEEDLITRIT